MSRNHTPARPRGFLRRFFEPLHDAPAPSAVFWSRLFLYILVALAMAFGIWISVARIGQVVPAHGKLIPAGSAFEVQAPVDGVISEVLVHNGQTVSEGQLLVRLNREVAAAEISGLEKQREAILMDLKTLDQKRIQKETLEQQIPRAADIVKIKLESYEHYNKVSGVVSTVEILDRKAEWVNAQRALDQLQSDFARVSSELQQQQNEQARHLAEIESNIAAAMKKLTYHAISAPLGGVIFDLSKKAAGTVLAAKDKVCDIIPGEDLVAEVFLANKDIGFVREGQEVTVRIDTFPFREFGELSGSVSYLAADALPPEEEYKYPHFPARIHLNRQYLNHNGEKLQLKSGMAATVNIRIRNRTLLSILTDEFSRPFDGLESVR